MPDWATSLIATGVGACAALAGVWMQIRYQMRQARLASAAADRERWRGILSLVISFLAEPPQRGLIWPVESKDWDRIRDALSEAAAMETLLAGQVFELLETLSNWKVAREELFFYLHLRDEEIDVTEEGFDPHAQIETVRGPQRNPFPVQEQQLWEKLLAVRDKAIHETESLMAQR